ncbi:hypothetical protein NBRC116594_26720 [Shimia sp. NS0008-38b]
MTQINALAMLTALSFPGLAEASGFQSAFLSRCLNPLIQGGEFDTSGLMGPVALPNMNIGVKGMDVERRVWQTGDPNVSFGTMVSKGVFRGCGVTLKAFDGAPVRVLEDVLGAVGQTSEICHFDLTYRDLRGYRAVVRRAGSDLPILVNFSPAEGRDYSLLAWESVPEKVDRACSR